MEILFFGAIVGLAPMPTFTPPPTSSPFLDAVLDATNIALDSCDVTAKDRDGSWCFDANQELVADALNGLRGRKKAWWLDSPRPLRSIISRGSRHEISVVALPGGTELPAASFPAGSLLFFRPLLGQIEVRRVRRSENSPDMPPLELMRKTLTPTDPKALVLSGGSCHEFRAQPGVASGFLQVVLLPPTSRLPDAINVDVSGSIGWMAPPTEDTSRNVDGLVCGVTIGASLGDLMQIEQVRLRVSACCCLLACWLACSFADLVVSVRVRVCSRSRLPVSSRGRPRTPRARCRTTRRSYSLVYPTRWAAWTGL